MLSKLSGSKTYITLVGGMVALAWQYYTGGIDLNSLINGEIALLAGVFMRSGITTESAK